MRRRTPLALACAGALSLALPGPALAATGPSTTISPYVVPVADGVETTSLLTVGDKPAGNGYRMVGIPDGLGARTGAGGTLEVFMNHELGATAGVVRRHGQAGAFVSNLLVDKSTLAVTSGIDLIGPGQISYWDYPSGTFGATPSTAVPPFLAQSAAFNRFCSSSLTAPGQLLNPATGKGYDGQIYFGNEEGGDESRSFGILTDGTTKQLPRLGLFSWENTLAAFNRTDTTLVHGQEDAATGQPWMYVGAKQDAGDAFDKAGLTNGTSYVLDLINEAVSTDAQFRDGYTKGEPVPFDLSEVGWNQTGAAQNAEAAAEGLTLNRIEDGAWDPANPRDFYFLTTEGGATTTAPGTTNSRDGGGLWRIRYKDIEQPLKGGTLTLLLDGSEAPYLNKPDNMDIDQHGNLLIQEDPGGNAGIARIVAYDIGTGRRGVVAQSDPELFSPSSPLLVTNDEESSGIIDLEGITARGEFLFDAQVHKAHPDPELVQHGQLMLLKVASFEAVYSGLPAGGGGAPGPAGPPGPPGQNGTNGTNGTDGQDGADGETGEAGPMGPAGPAGATGPAGTNGTNGTNGANGAPGPAGPAGSPGPAGRDGQVNCTLNRIRTRITCRVTYPSARIARLVRGGRTVARGRVVKGRVRFVAGRKLARGSYTLVAGGKATRLTVR